jgi:hypothetical protein
MGFVFLLQAEQEQVGGACADLPATRIIHDQQQGHLPKETRRNLYTNCARIDRFQPIRVTFERKAGSPIW